MSSRVFLTSLNRALTSFEFAFAPLCFRSKESGRTAYPLEKSDEMKTNATEHLYLFNDRFLFDLSIKFRFRTFLFVPNHTNVCFIAEAIRMPQILVNINLGFWYIFGFFLLIFSLSFKVYKNIQILNQLEIYCNFQILLCVTSLNYTKSGLTQEQFYFFHIRNCVEIININIKFRR